MNFQEQLKNVMAGVEGAEAAVLMGFDGIPVAEVKSDTTTLVVQDVCVELSRILADAVKTAQAIDLGLLEELTLVVGRNRFIFRVLSPTFFVALILPLEGNTGKGRYLLRRVAPELLSDL